MPVHDTRWDMRLLPFCPTTWQMLERTCGCCGRDQQWTVANGVDRCDNLHCVTSLSKTPAKSVPSDLQAPLSLAVGLCSPFSIERKIAVARIHGPADLSEQQGFDLLALVTTLAHGARYGNFRISGPNTEYKNLLLSLADSCNILLNWPNELRIIDVLANRLSPRREPTSTSSSEEYDQRNLPVTCLRPSSTRSKPRFVRVDHCAPNIRRKVRSSQTQP